MVSSQRKMQNEKKKKKKNEINDNDDEEKWINFAVHARWSNRHHLQAVFDLNKADKSTAISKQVSFPTCMYLLTRTHSLTTHTDFHEPNARYLPYLFYTLLDFVLRFFSHWSQPYMTLTVRVANDIETTDIPTANTKQYTQR